MATQKPNTKPNTKPNAKPNTKPNAEPKKKKKETEETEETKETSSNPNMQMVEDAKAYVAGQQKKVHDVLEGVGSKVVSRVSAFVQTKFSQQTEDKPSDKTGLDSSKPEEIKLRTPESTVTSTSQSAESVPEGVALDTGSSSVEQPSRPEEEEDTGPNLGS